MTGYPYAIEYDAQDRWITVSDPEGAAQVVAENVSLGQFRVLMDAITANVAAHRPDLLAVIAAMDLPVDVIVDNGTLRLNAENVRAAILNRAAAYLGEPEPPR